MALPTGQNPVVLIFWNFQTLEGLTGGRFDGAIVEVSVDNGSDLDPGAQRQPADRPLRRSRLDHHRQPARRPSAWCGDPQPYLRSVVDLSSYAGQRCAVRFRLGSDNSVARTDGWNLDDIVVESCALDRMPFVDGFESGATAAWSRTHP